MCWMGTPTERVSLVALNSFPRGPSSYPTHCWLYQLQSEKQSKVNGAQHSEEHGSVTVYPPRRQVMSTNATHVVFVGCSQGWGLGKGWVTCGRHCKPGHQPPLGRKLEKPHVSESLAARVQARELIVTNQDWRRKRAGVTHRDPASWCALAKMPCSGGRSLKPWACAGSRGSVFFLLEQSHRVVWLSSRLYNIQA